ncbi:MAG: outer membrane protein assembly factor BamB [Gammaproteobacteria bacterium]|nr:outer membrane protein assembly factor BamB [Gammaproteobacteria bacterium]
MSLRKRLLLVMVLGSAVNGCALWEDDDVTPPAPLPEAQSLELKPLWSESVGSGLGEGYSRLTPAVAAGKVFAADYEGHVEALNAATGDTLWEQILISEVNPDPESSWYEFWNWFDGKPKARTAGAVGVGSGLVLVGTLDAEVIALDAETGAEKWRNLVSSEVVAPPVVAEGRVLVRTIDGKLFALDAETGKRAWLYDRSVPVLTLRGTSAATASRGAALASFDSGKVAAVFIPDGRVIWEKSLITSKGRSEFDRVSDMDADPVATDDVVYVVSYHGQVAALDLRSGETLWQREQSSFRQMGIDERALYVTDEESHVRALELGSGASLWTSVELNNRGLTGPTAFGNYVVVGDFEGYVHFLSREDGHYLGRYEVDDDGIESAPVVDGDTMYVYGRGGELTAFKLP